VLVQIDLHAVPFEIADLHVVLIPAVERWR
jgi:hypothetical protein